MADASTLIANERIKSLAGLLFNAGGGLFAAAIVRFYSAPEIDLPIIIWSIGAATLIWFGWLALPLQVSET